MADQFILLDGDDFKTSDNETFLVMSKEADTVSKNIQLKDIAGDYLLYPKTLSHLVEVGGGGNLGTVEPGAQVNLIEEIMVNGTVLTINNKSVDISTSDHQYTILKQDTPEDGFIATYFLEDVDTNLPVGEKINIPKDYLVKSATCETCSEDDNPVHGYRAGDKYLDFIINTVDSDENSQHMYILVTDLVDVYTAGNGITLSSGVFAIDTSVVQTTSNLVSAFQETVDDIHYPSEKLVKDQLDLKADYATSITGYGITDAYTKAEVDTLIEAKSGADGILYHDESYPTVEAALDELLYIKPTASLSGGGTYEIGKTISTVSLTWSYNKNVATQSLNQGIGSLLPEVRAYSHEGQSITSNRTYTITGCDGKNTATASTIVAFSHKRYWGVSTETSLTDEQIIALSSEFSSSRVQSRVFNCSGGKYFYIVIATQYCTGLSMTVGGLSYTDFDLTTRNFTNANGNTTQFNIYRSGNLQTGSAINVGVN